MSIVVTKTINAPTFSSRQLLGEKVVSYPESDGKLMGETAFHIKLIINLFQTLETYFLSKTDVCIIADMMFYYQEDNPQKCISPDVMVVKGVGNYLRRVFKLWEENVPEVIFEISSRKTWQDDLQKKYTLYENLGVKEYYVFDPEYDYLPEPFLAYHLKGNAFKQIKVKKGRVFSPSLNLEIVDTGKTLRLYNLETENFLPTMEELQTEVRKLKAELAKLKEQN